MSSLPRINGIQQIGLGCSDSAAVFKWYRQHLGFDIRVFEDEAEARLMQQYTGDRVHSRHAILAMNLRGGGGIEIWQYRSRKAQTAAQALQIGDTGVNAMLIRSSAVQASYHRLRALGDIRMSEMHTDGLHRSCFLCYDPWDNLLQITADDYAFSNQRLEVGGIMGALIGVSDMQTSLKFYQEVLGYDQVLYDLKRSYTLPGQASETSINRRVALRMSRPGTGGFARLLGPTELHLVQSKNRQPNQIYENRYWGDLGYIHICFDVAGMDALRLKCAELNHPFTVDSATGFDMGDAAGQFSYIEDPDGTLIEFVETHKVPMIKKLGLSIDMRKRDPLRPLPNWLVKAMRIHRVT